MRSFISVLFFFLIHLQIHAQGIPYFDAPIKADGILDEPVWQEISPFNGFYNFFPINEGEAEFDTDIRVYHDGKYLNIAFVYHDSSSEVRANSLKRDNYGSGFHFSDCVGVIIDPYRDQNRGYFFALNGKGTQLDALIANYDSENLSWDAIWESGNSVQETDKVYEMKIPLSVISYEEQLSNWGFQFYTRDAKTRMYTVWNKFDRGFLQFDTRFLKPLEIENLQASKMAKTTVIPALTVANQKDQLLDTAFSNIQASLDLQYKISNGLRLDIALNPDFSQVDVDQQVTNLTRFNIIFPERRNFFIENSDLFTTLGAARDISPFYSRFIGAEQDILLGVKLSGNLNPNTRIGLLNVQSKAGDFAASQNYTVAVAKQLISPVFNTTGYLINRQGMSGLEFTKDFNRVAGLKINYLSKKRKWSGFTTYSHSFNDQLNQDAHAFSIENNYNTRTLSLSTKLNTVGRNYLTDIGFVPRIYNYDALQGETTRAGYTQISQSLIYNYFPKNQKTIQTVRLANSSVDTYLDEKGKVFEVNYFHNMALFFSNQTSMYVNLYHDDIELKYAFDPFRNGSFILPEHYLNSAVRIGWNSDYTRNTYGSVNFQIGSFYQGKRSRFGFRLGQRILPLFNMEFNYEFNQLSWEELGQQNLHLVGWSTELFFNTKLNWTTYFQYNEQMDNFNINSRLQWEYKPLSFVYLVFSNNYTGDLVSRNWGLSLKVNRRLNF